MYVWFLVCLIICLFVCLFACLFIYLSICLPICPSVCLTRKTHCERERYINEKNSNNEMKQRETNNEHSSDKNASAKQYYVEWD